MHIKPIETHYRGYRFRSRLEARWAVFFDTLGVEWEYEPEGFVLPNGSKYLPDFRLKCYGTRGNIQDKPFVLYVEVKGEMTREDHQKILDFSGWSYLPDYNPDDNGFDENYHSAIENMNPVLIVGNIPEVSKTDDTYDNDIFKCYEGWGFFNYETIDADDFGAYPSVKDGKFFLMGDDGNYIDGDLSLVVKAYQTARQARFEYGESPRHQRVLTDEGVWRYNTRRRPYPESNWNPFPDL